MARASPNRARCRQTSRARKRFRKPKPFPPETPTRSRSPTCSANLAKGPLAASAVDDMVERGRLSVASVDKAKEELGVVAVRLNRGRGALVHLAFPHQAEASVMPG
jgi:hypothetical protein